VLVLVRVLVVEMKLLMGMDLETEVELSPVAKAEAVVFSPYSSPSTALLLQRRVVSWYGCSSFKSPMSTTDSLFVESSH
jgi:hypothetical protein